MRTDRFNLILKKKMGQKSKRLLCRLLYPFRNDFILFNISNRAKKGKVNLDYWDEANNLGDILSPVVVDYVLGLRGLNRNVNINGKKHLYAVGSVITAGIQDATIWGSGILNPVLLYRLRGRKLDVRAVRGPITRAILLDYGYNVPAVYGDPAILMTEIYSPQKIDKTNQFGLIIHKDYDLTKVEANVATELDDILTIDIRTDNYEQFIKKLLSVKTIISSSLHGIILAESYGIKAVLLKPQVDIIKYYDYYYSTHRLDFPIAETIRDAMQIKPVELPQNLNELREELKKSFPYDLFE